MRILLPLILIFAIFALPAQAKTARVSRARCDTFFEEILPDTAEDLALVPYVQGALQEIYSVLNAKNLSEEQLVANIVESDIRVFAFRLEAISKALKSVDERAYEAFHTEAVMLENGIGDYQFETELFEYLKESPEVSGLVTPEAESFFKGRISSAHDRLVRDLYRNGWVGKLSAYERILGIVADSEPITKKSYLKRKLLKSLSKQLRDIHEELVSGELNLNEIEDGIHKLRRELRMVAVTLLSFPGMFYLDQEIKVTGIKLAGNELKKSFTPSTDALLKRAIGISRDGYLFIMEMVGALGKLKSRDGIREYVSKALKDGALGEGVKPLERAVSESPDAKESLKLTRKKGKQYAKMIVDSKVLLQIADQLDVARDTF